MRFAHVKGEHLKTRKTRKERGNALRACEGGTSKDTKDTKGERECATRRNLRKSFENLSKICDAEASRENSSFSFLSML